MTVKPETENALNEIAKAAIDPEEDLESLLQQLGGLIHDAAATLAHVRREQEAHLRDDS